MDNRNRDKMSKESNSPTSAGDVNRSVSEQKGHMGDGSTPEFGRKIGQSEGISGSSGRSSGSSGRNSNSGSGSDSGRH